MAVSDHVAQFQNLGHPAKDTRHVSVYVYPAIAVENGQLVERHKIYVGTKNGDFDVTVPTDFIFMTAHLDWKFEKFSLGGRSWDGIAAFPDDGDFSVRFGDAEQRSVILADHCTKLYTHRYQIVMRNIHTGELIATDPSTQETNSPPILP